MYIKSENNSCRKMYSVKFATFVVVRRIFVKKLTSKKVKIFIIIV